MTREIYGKVEGIAPKLTRKTIEYEINKCLPWWANFELEYKSEPINDGIPEEKKDEKEELRETIHGCPRGQPVQIMIALDGRGAISFEKLKEEVIAVSVYENAEEVWSNPSTHAIYLDKLEQFGAIETTDMGVRLTGFGQKMLDNYGRYYESMEKYENKNPEDFK